MVAIRDGCFREMDSLETDGGYPLRLNRAHRDRAAGRERRRSPVPRLGSAPTATDSGVSRDTNLRVTVRSDAWVTVGPCAWRSSVSPSCPTSTGSPTQSGTSRTSSSIGPRSADHRARGRARAPRRRAAWSGCGRWSARLPVLPARAAGRRRGAGTRRVPSRRRAPGVADRAWARSGCGLRASSGSRPWPSTRPTSPGSPVSTASARDLVVERWVGRIHRRCHADAGAVAYVVRPARGARSAAPARLATRRRRSTCSDPAPRATARCSRSWSAAGRRRRVRRQAGRREAGTPTGRARRHARHPAGRDRRRTRARLAGGRLPGATFTGMLGGAELAHGVRVARRVRPPRRRPRRSARRSRRPRPAAYPSCRRGRRPARPGRARRETGLLFDPADPASLVDAVATFAAAHGSARPGRGHGAARRRHPHLGASRRRARRATTTCHWCAGDHPAERPHERPDRPAGELHRPRLRRDEDRGRAARPRVRRGRGRSGCWSSRARATRAPRPSTATWCRSARPRSAAGTG